MQNVWFSHDDVVWEKTLIVNCNRVDLMRLQIHLCVLNFFKIEVANRARRWLFQPVKDTVWMKNVEARQHSTLAIIRYRLQAHNAFFNHVLPVLHPDKLLLQLVIGFDGKAFRDWDLSTLYVRTFTSAGSGTAGICRVPGLPVSRPKRFSWLNCDEIIFGHFPLSFPGYQVVDVFSSPRLDSNGVSSQALAP